MNEKRVSEVIRTTAVKAIVVIVSALFFITILASSLSENDIFHSYGIVHFFIMFSIPCILFLCNCCNRYIRILNPIIEYCGRYSLQIYLLHVAFIRIAFSPLVPGDKNVIVVLALVMSILMASLLHKVSQPVYKLLVD